MYIRIIKLTSYEGTDLHPGEILEAHDKVSAKDIKEKWMKMLILQQRLQYRYTITVKGQEKYIFSDACEEMDNCEMLIHLSNNREVT